MSALTRNMQAGNIRSILAPGATLAKREMEKKFNAKEQWPFPWVYPPPNSTPTLPFGIIQTNATGAANQATVLTYAVPTGFRFYFKGVIFEAYGFAYIPGMALWSVQRNTAASANVQGSPVAFLSNIPVPYGLAERQAFELPRAIVFEAGDAVRVVVNNVSSPVGAPNFFFAQLWGWNVPAE